MAICSTVEGYLAVRWMAILQYGGWLSAVRWMAICSTVEGYLAVRWMAICSTVEGYLAVRWMAICSTLEGYLAVRWMAILQYGGWLSAVRCGGEGAIIEITAMCLCKFLFCRESIWGSQILAMFTLRQSLSVQPIFPFYLSRLIFLTG